MIDVQGQLIKMLRSQDDERVMEAVATLRTKQTDLRGETLIRVNLRYADLTGMDLRETVLIWLDARGANLRGVDMRQAVLFRADLQGANLAGADLRRTYLLKANLLNANLEGAQFDEGTTLPDGDAWSPETDLSRFTDADHPDFWRDPDPTSPAAEMGYDSSAQFVH